MGTPFTAILGNATLGTGPAVHIPDVKKWTCNPKAENQAYASSDSAGWKQRVKGILDCSGTIDCLVTDDATLMSIGIIPGAKIPILTLLLNGTVNFVGPAIIDDVSFDINVESGEIEGATITWSGDGEWEDFLEPE